MAEYTWVVALCNRRVRKSREIDKPDAGRGTDLASFDGREKIIGPLAGIDYGLKRIGLALSDRRHRLATPALQIDASPDAARTIADILRWAAQNEVAGFVIGLPLNMDGSDGPQARKTRKFADALRAATDRPVHLWDERLSSFQADEHLAATGWSAEARKRRRDALAAQVILQSYLDAAVRSDVNPPAPET